LAFIVTLTQTIDLVLLPVNLNLLLLELFLMVLASSALSLPHHRPYELVRALGPTENATVSTAQRL
jgi:hypothetical protein